MNAVASEADLATRRLYAQRLTGPAFPAPADVVRWFGAVQAQEYYDSLYAVGLRMAGAVQAQVEQAIADRAIIRSWPMRGTIHYMAAEDARWLIALLARRADGQGRSIHRRLGLTAEVFEAAGPVFERALSGGKALTRGALYAALGAAGIDASESRGMHLVGSWARRGLICFGPRQGKQHTFVLLEEWAPPGRNLSGDAALAELATRYFTSHGPATARDFAWWAGLGVRQADAAIQLAGDALSSEIIAGRAYWCGPAAAAIAPRPVPEVYLLPPFDEFTVGYADRSAFTTGAEPDAYDLIDFIMLIDRRIAGTWRRRFEKDRVLVDLRPLRPLTAAEEAALDAAVARYAAFVGLAAETVLRRA